MNSMSNAEIPSMAASVLMFALGVWLAWKSTRNLVSGVFLTTSTFGLFFIGGWIYVIQEFHVLTPFAVAWATLFFGFGAFIVAGVLKFRPRSELQTCKRKLGHSSARSDSALYFAVLILSGLTFVLVAWFFARAGIIILSSNTSLTRAHAAQGRGVQFRGVNVLLPICLLMAYSLKENSKWKAGRIFLLITALLSFVVIILSGSRGYASVYIISGMILLGYTPRQINRKALILVILLFILLATVIQYSYSEYRSFTPWEAVGNVLLRTTRSQAQGLDYIIYDLVPEEGFYYGRVLAWDFSGLLSTCRLMPHGETFSGWLWQRFANFQFPDQSFSLSTATIGDLYADFGFTGVALGMMIYGSLAQLLYVIPLRMRKHWFWIVVFAYAQYIPISAHISGSIFGVFSIRGLSLLAYVFAVLFIASLVSRPMQISSSSPSSVTKVAK